MTSSVFYTVYIYSTTAIITNYEEYLVYWMGAVRWMVDNCPTEVFHGFPSFQTRVLPCYIMLTKYLCWRLVRLMPF